ncbi:methyltransferase domain-containing protein [uncultured Robinsoniella sp.]|uniref:MerR family transcriptional regulator n=1 Tax=uncultured Robinsoniella sp. TaxID=904190 RepID=UPI00374FB8C9
MKIPGYYSSGEFASLSHITKKTLRYYDEHQILKPSYVNDSGARFYTYDDFARLQQILLLKYLGFSLDDIREMTITNTDEHFMVDSLNLQLKLVEDRIEQMQLVAQTIRDTSQSLQEQKTVDWCHMLELIHVMGMEKSLKNQYQNASNIAARINLHHLYSKNTQGWFPWIYEQCHIKSGNNILELGCGDGTLWAENFSIIPSHIHITLSDISEGMLRDTRRSIGSEESRFDFNTFDCCHIPYKDNSFDLVLANHVLFYCEDIAQVCREVIRVLKNGGTFICSTYGSLHMNEVSQLVSDFDDRIVLSADKLYERFGRENGNEILSPFFSEVLWKSYDDSLLVPDSETLISYVLSCHGNQNQYIVDRFKDFRSFVKKKTTGGFYITKDAGIFICRNL